MNAQHGKGRGRLSFGARLTLMIIAIVILALAAVTAVLYTQYHRTHTQMIISGLEGEGRFYTQSFSDWLDARQDEMRYLATLAPATAENTDQLNHLLQRIAELDGAYDTIFQVRPDGRGLVGVSYGNGRAQVMSTAQAGEFNVPDRAWFRSAIGGDEVFSQPVVSRATGNLVSTVAVPVRDGSRIVGVMRGAVTLDSIIQRVRNISTSQGTEIYLINQRGEALTPTASVADPAQPLTTEAARAIADMRSGAGRYRNAAGDAVVGTYAAIPTSGWGLILEQNESVAMAPVRATMWTMMLMVVVILILAIAAGLGIVRSVTRTLGGDPSYATDRVTQVAEGDLTTPIKLREGDNSSLLASIGRMKDNLRKMMGQIGKNAEALAAASTELSQISAETDQGVRRQTDQIDSAATAMNEMAATVEEVARNAQTVADSTVDAAERANSGRQVVSQSSAAIKQLATEISGAAEVVNALKVDSDTIGSVLKVIRDVAEQTNLLALNASIEAARAGDSGRGFAVVADEVRNLASRTHQSTNEIQQAIDQLQSRAEKAVKVMEASVERADSSLSLAQDADQALDEIATIVASINDMIQQIASATEEQTSVAREINENIHAVKEVSEQSASNVTESTQATESLSRLAEQLREEMGHFRV